MCVCFFEVGMIKLYIKMHPNICRCSRVLCWAVAGGFVSYLSNIKNSPQGKPRPWRAVAAGTAYFAVPG